jgi:hypothetical protein
LHVHPNKTKQNKTPDMNGKDALRETKKQIKKANEKGNSYLLRRDNSKVA